MKSEYLLFNILIILIPITISLVFPRYNISNIPRIIRASVFGSLPILLFDFLVAGYFWKYNPKYILGINIFSLPLEELFFFITIPFAIIYAWQQFKKITKKEQHTSNTSKHLILQVLLILLIFYATLTALYYTAGVLIMTLLVINNTWIKNNLLDKTGIKFIGLVAIFTLIFNWYLTYRPIVIYNTQVKTNLLITTIPIEDFFFSFILTALVVFTYEKIVA
jgi:lycopene cyclase domain-containing protein